MQQMRLTPRDQRCCQSVPVKSPCVTRIVMSCTPCCCKRLQHETSVPPVSSISSTITACGPILPEMLSWIMPSRVLLFFKNKNILCHSCSSCNRLTAVSGSFIRSNDGRTKQRKPLDFLLETRTFERERPGLLGSHRAMSIEGPWCE